jgi:very-short-patch-repair endonuclease
MSKEWRASKIVKQAARRLRHDLTPAERILWAALRRRQVDGLRFRRQHPIRRFIVDFCCVEKRLIIEVDGEIHRIQQAEDFERQDSLEAQGYTVLRFQNQEVEHNLPDVIKRIMACASRIPPHSRK